MPELACPGQVDGAVGREALEECFERRRPDVVQGAEHGDSPQRLTVEDERILRSAGVVGELRQGRWPAPNDDDAVVGGALVAQVRSEFLPLRAFDHGAVRPGRSRSPISWAASSCKVGETWL